MLKMIANLNNISYINEKGIVDINIFQRKVYEKSFNSNKSNKWE